MGTINQTSIVLVWFKRDLRISDHEPLIAAIATGLPIMPVYVVETDYWQTSVASRRHWCFLRDCLESLDQMLHTYDQSLVIRVDQDAQMAFDKLAQSYDIKAIYAYEETGNDWTYQRDMRVQRWCQKKISSYLNLQTMVLCVD